MLILKGKHIYLRALEPEDLEFLYELENNTAIWEISGTKTPYARHVLRTYLDNAFKDIYEVKQLRLGICNNENRLLGLIDLFDFDPGHMRAGVGIVILESEDRNHGIGTEALTLLLDYAFATLNLHQVYANVGKDNEGSLHLFTKLGFEQIGIKKDWIRRGKEFKDEVMLQKINS
ncbi:MAG: GNAT family N-acetyltransferase [Bacteroidia bacterium]|nr:GNAT family N-acetyltransferase [Bacteroidia bacterium]